MKKNCIHELSSALARLTNLDQTTVLELLERPKNPQFGDIAFPTFSLSKTWELSPKQCAEKLKLELALPSGISSAECAGPFLNFRFDREQLVRETIETVLRGRAPTTREQKIIVEYSSPNIAKPFHVGHLRATLVGNCLDRLYRYLGYQVTSINHLGDWGTQFGFVWAGCQLWGKPTVGTIPALVELYRQATTLKEKQEKDGEVDGYPNVNEMARGYFLQLERGEEQAVQFWKWCVDISLEYLKRTYERLHVAFDHYTGESFYSDKLDSVKRDLEQANLLQFSEGAYGVQLGEELGFARIYTPDGRSLYLTRDLAAAKYRAETFHFDKALYVVGAPQALHFRQIKAILKALKRDYADKITHVPFGHVLGMKTRGEGEFIELNDFLDEAYKRSLEAYHQQVSKRPEGLDDAAVASAVALGAIIFSTLGVSNIKDVHFRWEHALEFQGDSGPYLLYAYARINGIREKATDAGITPTAKVSAAQLTDDSAYSLVLLLSNFDEVLERTISDNEPSHLVNYALEIAKSFSRAYNDLKVLGAPKETAEARLTLFEATRLVLRTTIELLGMTPIERM